MIKRVEVNYRGIFQKNLGKKIGSDIVMIASRMGQKAFSNGRYSDSPERNGIPCKYFAFVSPDLAEEELEATLRPVRKLPDALHIAGARGKLQVLAGGEVWASGAVAGLCFTAGHARQPVRAGARRRLCQRAPVRGYPQQRLL